MNQRLKKICKSILIALGVFIGLSILFTISITVTEFIKGLFRLTALHMIVGLSILFFITLIIIVYDGLPNHKKTTYDKDGIKLTKYQKIKNY